MDTFERENRYIVLKRKHLGSLPEHLQIRLKPALEDAAQLLPKLDCLVVESDWPEYEPTWRAIEQRMTGVTGVADWSGALVPAPGAKVELRTAASADWSLASIVFASRNVIVWDYTDEPAVNGLCVAYAHEVEVRPARSPEQIAAEKREAMAKQLFTETFGHPASANWDRLSEERRQDFLNLIDAGWTKQVKE